MTAPGNSTLLLTLLAALIASTGYAGGRIHQWYRMGRDRDEAFRDGYDTATRSVFSLAARVISPRRADRAAIRVAGSVVNDAPVPAVRIVAGEWGASSGSGVSGGSADPVAVVTPIRSANPFGSAVRPAPAASAAPADPFAAAPPMGEAGPLSSVASARNAPTAFSVVPAAPGSLHSSLVGRRPPAAADPAESSGRHTVPDALVQADTYRLAPDRVARAKVHGRVTPAAAPTTDGKPRAKLPKPRSS